MRRGGTKKKLQKKWNVKKCGKTKRGAEKCTDRVVWRYRKKYDVYAERHVPCRWSSGEPGAIARIKEDLSEAERADSFADKWAVLYLRDAPPMRSARSTPRSSLGFPLGFFLFLAFFFVFLLEACWLTNYPTPDALSLRYLPVFAHAPRASAADPITRAELDTILLTLPLRAARRSIGHVDLRIENTIAISVWRKGKDLEAIDLCR